MKIRGLVALALTTVITTGFSAFASAGAIPCGDSNGVTTRSWTFDSAEACGTGEGNPENSAAIEGLGGLFNLGADDWTKHDGISQTGDSSSWLDVSFISGSWDDKVITATWTLATGFWGAFDNAVFSVHVGGGSHADLDDFAAFFITQGQYSGTWSFTQDPTTGKNGGSGGLSNTRLWTTGTGIIDNPQEPPASVPEPGMLLLFASGLLGLGLKGRKVKA